MENEKNIEIPQYPEEAIKLLNVRLIQNTCGKLEIYLNVKFHKDIVDIINP